MVKTWRDSCGIPIAIDAQRALDLMAQHQIRRIPVVGDNRRLLGIIAQADIATRMDAPRRTAAVVEEISQPSAE